MSDLLTKSSLTDKAGRPNGYGLFLHLEIGSFTHVVQKLVFRLCALLTWLIAIHAARRQLPCATQTVGVLCKMQQVAVRRHHRIKWANPPALTRVSLPIHGTYIYP